MNEDDFFSPRPKLSPHEKLVRGYAIFYAIGMSCLFVAIYFWVYDLFIRQYKSDPEDVMLMVLIWVGLHFILLLPAWRCYFLKRWGWVLVIVLSALIFFVLIFVHLIFLPFLTLLLMFWYYIESRWPILESGF